MKRLLVLCIYLNLGNICFCQNDGVISSKNFYLTVFSDTIISKGNDYTLMHFHVVSENIKRMILFDENDSIFDDKFNKFSRLIFKGLQHSFNVPTIPLNHLIYLKDKKLIIGLSKIAISPYQVVIYSDDGRLIFKGTINQFTLRLSKSQINNFAKKHPGFLNCLLETPIVKENDLYQISVSRCLLNVIGRDSIRGILNSNPYFPFMSHPTDQQYYNTDLYYNFYSDSDPIYDIVMAGSVPFLLILNSEDGEKIAIPLVSNCNILTEIEGIDIKIDNKNK